MRCPSKGATANSNLDTDHRQDSNLTFSLGTLQRTRSHSEIMEQNEMINIVPCSEEEGPLIEDNNIQDNIDFVLVAKKTENANDKNKNNRQLYLRELNEKGFRIMKKEDSQNQYFGIEAREEIFKEYIHHTNVSQGRYAVCKLHSVTESTRIRIINFILWKTKCPKNGDKKDSISLRKLLKDGAFQAVFPLHENNSEKGGKLRHEWAKWKCLFKKQPINEIRDYFGERIALYFAWLGWYNTMLLPAALTGVLVFLYGFISFENNQVSKEICSATDIVMCPLCDQRCQFWRLNETCSYAKVTQLFDHEVTVIFAMIMAIWATVFLEIWKRARAKAVSSWDLYHWDEDEEDLILGLIYNPTNRLKEYQHSYKRTTIVMLLACILITVIIGIALGIVIFRVIVAVLFTKSSSEFLSDHAYTAAVAVGALLHFLTILIMTKINRKLAKKLCDLECPRTILARENSFTVKMFTFQFLTMFSSIIYVAFFLGRINGHPSNYVRIASQWRLEECHPSGCMTDLFIQMAVVMILKQLLSSFVEYSVPSLKHRWKKYHKKILKENVKDEIKDHWMKNYSLNSVNSFSLFNEFLEMAIQYSFTTIFVAAFPLAPLLALVNNLFEVRLDARKMLLLQRRPIPRKANDIGIWVKILEAIGVLAVIGNGLVIAITSDFIPRLVYRYEYGPCADGYSSVDSCLMGYVNNSLSVFHVKNFENETRLKDNGSESLGFQVKYCRYRDYRTDNDYEYTIQFWHIFAARLGFLVLFENVVVCIKYIVAWFVPDVPTSVRNQHLRQTHNRLKKELPVSPRNIPYHLSSNLYRQESTTV
ncbi:anoctamin-9-like isoform X2 [Hemitrygon akajei]|uniref:anoctamin-9-like isoform X2 n=1 Tax=Hemitrygon akajei TaxID=2704970 RepID=UPI003BF9912F